MRKGKIIPHPVVFTLILLNLIALILEYAVFGGTSPESLVKAGGLYAPSIQNGQIYRLLTTVFLHSGYTHFIVNAFCLFSLGTWIEKGIGHKWTLFIYLFGGLFSSMITYQTDIAWATMRTPVVTVGASGAISAFLGALVVFKSMRPEWMSFTTPGRLLAGAFMMILPILFAGNISIISYISGQIGGMTAGVIIILIKKNQSERVNIEQ